ncbi:MAG: Gfo/Idh/MocA family protein [Bacillota bacterium]
MEKLKFAAIGCGFWAQFQIAAWHEFAEEVELVAVYNRTREKAEKIAKKYKVPSVYESAGELMEKEDLDFVDIITHVSTHEKFVKMAADNEIPVICQKPMAPDYRTAKNMVKYCQQRKVPFIIHENWRWQKPIRKVKSELDSGVIGKPFRARISYNNSFPVFENQPSLAKLNRFIINDMGTHILDITRFLLGEAESIYCQTVSVQDIEGEDVASIALRMENGVHCNVEISYASRIENDRFPETFILIEGTKGSIKLGPDYQVKITTEKGTFCQRVEPPYYEWIDPEYHLVHSSIVDANKEFLQALKGVKAAETEAPDNLKTMKLVAKAYESAEKGEVVFI